MGGDTLTNLSFSHDEESSPDQDFSEMSSIIGDDFMIKGENRAIIGDDFDVLVSGKPDETSLRRPASSLRSEADQRRIRSVYERVLQSYEMQSSSLSEAKSKIWSYTPGKWIEKVGGMTLSDYDVPKTTTLILIGPRGSGKSSLVNRISKVFEDDKFASERAQVYAMGNQSSDDKPVIVLTHGDLLSLADRSRIRVYVGELVGIPPVKQIFDIPESCDPVTELTIIDMLRYSLERADRNLPCRKWAVHKISRSSLSASLYLFIILGILIAACSIQYAHRRTIPKPEPRIDWHSIRHLWSD